MEKINDCSGLGVERGNVAALPRIAAKARIGEIIEIRPAAVLAANDVIYLMRRVRVIFMKKAIFATVGCALRYRSP